MLATAVTPTAAQSLARGPVLIETHHTDLAGNIRLSTNEAGDVTQRLDYTPFGEIIGASCNGGGDPTLAPKFQGKLRDPKTCLDDFGARDYYMVTGRFQSVDPVLPLETALRDPQQWNRYAYARNNPLIYTDPDGRSFVFLRILKDFLLSFEVTLNAPAPGEEDDAVPSPTFTDVVTNVAADNLPGPGQGKGGANPNRATSPGGKGSNLRRTGRGKNKVNPIQDAQGPHSTYKRDQNGDISGYTEWEPNPYVPGRFREKKRFDRDGEGHYNKKTEQKVAPPHIHDPETPGKVRPARPEEIPKRPQ